MDLRRLRIGDWVTGVSGLALLLALWAPWYAVSDGTLNGWAAFGLIDLWLVLTALLAIAVLVATALRDAPAVPVALDVLCWSAAVIATLLVVARLLAEPRGEVVTGREWGAFAGLAAVLAVAAGAWIAMRDESAPGLRQPDGVELMVAPAPGTGPEPAKHEA